MVWLVDRNHAKYRYLWWMTNADIEVYTRILVCKCIRRLCTRNRGGPPLSIAHAKCLQFQSIRSLHLWSASTSLVYAASMLNVTCFYSTGYWKLPYRRSRNLNSFRFDELRLTPHRSSTINRHGSEVS